MGQWGEMVWMNCLNIGNSNPSSGIANCTTNLPAISSIILNCLWVGGAKGKLPTLFVGITTLVEPCSSNLFEVNLGLHEEQSSTELFFLGGGLSITDCYEREICSGYFSLIFSLKGHWLRIWSIIFLFCAELTLVRVQEPNWGYSTVTKYISTSLSSSFFIFFRWSYLRNPIVLQVIFLIMNRRIISLIAPNKTVHQMENWSTNYHLSIEHVQCMWPCEISQTLL